MLENTSKFASVSFSVGGARGLVDVVNAAVRVVACLQCRSAPYENMINYFIRMIRHFNVQ